jgi:hypothetical protein
VIAWCHHVCDVRAPGAHLGGEEGDHHHAGGGGGQPVIYLRVSLVRVRCMARWRMVCVWLLLAAAAGHAVQVSAQAQQENR